MEITGKNINKKRKELGITQKELADFIGVSYQTIQNWEGGKNIPKSKYQILGSFLSKNNFNVVSEPQEKYFTKNDVSLLDDDDEVEVFTNKNRVKFFIYPDDTYKIEVPMIPFKAYASSDIECYFDEDYRDKEFKKYQFTVDKIGKGNSLRLH